MLKNHELNPQESCDCFKCHVIFQLITSFTVFVIKSQKLAMPSVSCSWVFSTYKNKQIKQDKKKKTTFAVFYIFNWKLIHMDKSFCSGYYSLVTLTVLQWITIVNFWEMSLIIIFPFCIMVMTVSVSILMPRFISFQISSNTWKFLVCLDYFPELIIVLETILGHVLYGSFFVSPAWFPRQNDTDGNNGKPLILTLSDRQP